MLRAAALSIALLVLEAACALTEPPPPPGTRLLQVEVQNGFVQPAQLAVGTEQAVIIGAAQPATVKPRSTTLVDFFVPLGPEWTIVVNGQPVIRGADLSFPEPIKAGDIVIGIDPEGGTFWRCRCF